MQNITLVAALGMIAGLIWLLDRRNKQHVDLLRELLHSQETDRRRMLEDQQDVFTEAVAAVSDATAKAVQSITYPETLAPAGQQPTNDQLQPVREMPVRTRDLSLDYTDPTDGTMPEVAIRADVGVLGDDVHGPLGIPGLTVDPLRYADTRVDL